VNIYFRVDSSCQIGSGHVMRCLALAEELRLRGAQITFICRQHEGNINSLINDRLFNLIEISNQNLPYYDGGEYSSWLGTEQEIDAQQTIVALNTFRPELIIVDHYALDACWESLLNSYSEAIFVIDDIANRVHVCDFLLDANYSMSDSFRYRDLVPQNTKLMLGTDYALMAPVYRTQRLKIRKRDGSVRRILIYFGGSDTANITGLCLKALCSDIFSDVIVDVVLGAMNPHFELIQDLVATRSNTNIYRSIPNLSDLINKADLALGAAGVTTWERMSLGLPSLVISIAENQEPAATALSNAGLITYLGVNLSVSEESIVAALNAKFSDDLGLAKESRMIQELVDGYGAVRVAEIIIPTPVEFIAQSQVYDFDVSHVVDKIASLPQNFRNKQHTLRSLNLQSKANDISDRCFLEFRLSDLVVSYFIFIKTSDGILVLSDSECSIVTEDRIIRFFEQAVEALYRNIPSRVEGLALIKNQLTWNNYLHFGPKAILDETASHAIAILSDKSSWINELIGSLVRQWLDEGHRVLWVHDKNELLSGDFCFYLGCEQIVEQKILDQFRYNLVVHESSLPQGKGWSPLTWHILQGENNIPIVLFEAQATVDSGDIYLQDYIRLDGSELIGELRAMQGRKTLEMVKHFVINFEALVRNRTSQSGDSTYFLKRGPDDGRIKGENTLDEVFQLLRVSDHENYPCFFEKNSIVFKVRLEK
jgi:UDP-2,4-diacetamido-2,4,6-trideoxy-beta-L-altropyranose hydrolase